MLGLATKLPISLLETTTKVVASLILTFAYYSLFSVFNPYESFFLSIPVFGVSFVLIHVLYRYFSKINLGFINNYSISVSGKGSLVFSSGDRVFENAIAVNLLATLFFLVSYSVYFASTLFAGDLSDLSLNYLTFTFSLLGSYSLSFAAYYLLVKDPSGPHGLGKSISLVSAFVVGFLLFMKSLYLGIIFLAG